MPLGRILLQLPFMVRPSGFAGPGSPPDGGHESPEDSRLGCARLVPGAGGPPKLSHGRAKLGFPRARRSL